MPLEAMPLSTPESEAAIGNLGILEAGSKRRRPLGQLTNDGTLSESHDLAKRSPAACTRLMMKSRTVSRTATAEAAMRVGVK